MWLLRDLDPLATWHHGRAVIIGDAAHAIQPHVGQGCNQGVESAEALACFLNDLSAPGSASAAPAPAAAGDAPPLLPLPVLKKQLDDFVALRQPRAQIYQLASRHFGGSLSGDALATLGTPFELDFTHYAKVSPSSLPLL